MRGLVRDEDRKAVAAGARSTGGADRSAHGGTDSDDLGSPSSSAAPERRPLGCSEALAKRLAAHRTMALQAMLAQNTALALASVVHVFVLRTFGADYPREASALQVSPQLSAYALEAVADDIQTSRAWQAVQQAKEAWQARLPEHQGEWFGWLIGLPQSELIELLTLCSALTLNALPGAGASASANALAAALGLDMADWWEPTPEGYLNHVPKAQIVEALTEAGPELAGDGLEAMKKDALVTAAASRLAGKRWLPEPLRQSPG
jgi:ParB family chromosome partitioning protein